MLTFAKSMKLLFPDFAFESPFFRQTAMPFADDLFSLRVVVVLRVGEFFGVVGTRLTCTQWL